MYKYIYIYVYIYIYMCIYMYVCYYKSLCLLLILLSVMHVMISFDVVCIVQFHKFTIARKPTLIYYPIV